MSRAVEALLHTHVHHPDTVVYCWSCGNPVFCFTEIRNFEGMHSVEMVKLGKRGQVSIPKSILQRLGLEGEVPMLVETTTDGAIVLRPAVVYPVELYSAERIAEFAEADRMDDATAERLDRLLATSR